jgi:hypothetical protein
VDVREHWRTPANAANVLLRYAENALEQIKNQKVTTEAAD